MQQHATLSIQCIGLLADARCSVADGIMSTGSDDAKDIDPLYCAMMHRVGFFIIPDHQILDLAGPFAVLEAAALLSGPPLYELDTLSRAGGVVAGRGGVPVVTKAADQAHLDTLVVCGGDISSMLKPGEVQAVVCLARRASRIASVCTGAFLLAEAGLRDGPRATTHRRMAHRLQRSYPSIGVDADRIFIADHNVWSSAGVTAGIDLALVIIEADHGAALARQVARELVIAPPSQELEPPRNPERLNSVRRSALTSILTAGLIRRASRLHEGTQPLAQPNRLLLLNPVSGALDHLDAVQLGRRLRLHQIESARRRVTSPVLFTADEKRRHIDRPARKEAEFRVQGRVGKDAISLQGALKTSATIFLDIHAKLRFGEPFARMHFTGGGMERGDRVGHRLTQIHDIVSRHLGQVFGAMVL
jgi:putative intracellular protease/amidase